MCANEFYAAALATCQHFTLTQQYLIGQYFWNEASTEYNKQHLKKAEKYSAWNVGNITTNMSIAVCNV